MVSMAVLHMASGSRLAKVALSSSACSSRPSHRRGRSSCWCSATRWPPATAWQRPTAFQAQLGAALRADGFDVQILDGGVSGDTTAGGRSRLDWALADKPGRGAGGVGRQ